MTKDHNKTGRSQKAPHHSRLYHWVADSAAWHSLSAGARAAYMMMLRRYQGSNNGAIPLSVREIADELHIGKSMAAVYLKELQSRGFITVTIRGAFSHRNKRATEWRLTEHTCDVTGEVATKEFMRWEPGRDFTVRPQVRTVPNTGPLGTCGRTEHAQKAGFGT